MTDTNLVWPAALAIIAVLVLASLFGVMAINKNVNSKQTPVVDFTPVVTAINANSAKLDKLIANSVPQTPGTTDTDKIDKLCSLTEGCVFYSAKDTDKSDALAAVKLDSRDFKKALATLVGIDKDFLTIQNVTVKEAQVRAYTKKDMNKDNWEVLKFVKVTYFDEDRTNHDVQTVYVLVTSTLDEGDYDSLTLTKVDRTFEFE